MRLPVSPASLSEIPHDQAQGGGRLGVRVPDLREALREGSQPERPHVYGAPADARGGSERQQPAAAALPLANHHAERRGGASGPGEVTAESPGLQPGHIDCRRSAGVHMSSPLRLFQWREKIWHQTVASNISWLMCFRSVSKSLELHQDEQSEITQQD